MAANNSEVSLDVSSQDRADSWSVMLTIVVVFLENLKWFIFLPLGVGVAVAAWAASLDRIYQSSTLIGPLDSLSGSVIAVLLNEPQFLDTTLVQLSEFEQGKPKEIRRQQLAQRISFRAVAGFEKLRSAVVYQLAISDKNPSHAQSLVSAVTRSIIGELNKQDANLRSQIAQKRNELAEIESLATNIRQKATELGALKPSNRPTDGEGLGLSEPVAKTQLELRVLQSQLEIQTSLIRLETRLAESDRGMVLMEPSLPTLPIGPPRRAYVIKAMTTTFVIVGLIVAMICIGRHVATLAAAQPDVEKKMGQIRELFPLRWLSGRRFN